MCWALHEYQPAEKQPAVDQTPRRGSVSRGGPFGTTSPWSPTPTNQSFPTPVFTPTPATDRKRSRSRSAEAAKGEDTGGAIIAPDRTPPGYRTLRGEEDGQQPFQTPPHLGSDMRLCDDASERVRPFWPNVSPSFLSH